MCVYTRVCVYVSKFFYIFGEPKPTNYECTLIMMAATITKAQKRHREQRCVKTRVKTQECPRAWERTYTHTHARNVEQDAWSASLMVTMIFIISEYDTMMTDWYTCRWTVSGGGGEGGDFTTVSITGVSRAGEPFSGVFHDVLITNCLTCMWIVLWGYFTTF